MIEEDKKLIQKVEKEIEKHKELIELDPYRLQYHLMPPVGLLNDPNGLVYFKGKYHVFYQWNPFATRHGIKFWGHYTSDNLAHWKKEPIALAPTDDFDKSGCYSGSAIVHDDQLYVFYTGNVKTERDERETYQCLAVSEDGIHFEKKGPIIHLPKGFTPHFRDPSVWKYNDRFLMTIGAQTVREEGCVVLYESENLYDWQFVSILTGSNLNGLGKLGYMWECPNLFSLQNKEVLLISPQGLEPSGMFYNNEFQSGYFIGDLCEESLKYEHGPFIELDRGFDFYAPQTMLDDQGRRLLFAWMGMTDNEEKFQPTISNGWIHTMTLPRQLILKGTKLYQKPVEELAQLRKDHINYPMVQLCNEEKAFRDVEGQAIELLIDFIDTKELEAFSLTIRHEAVLTFDRNNGTFTLSRTRLSDGKTSESRTCRVNDLFKLQIYLDTSSIEIFINDGEEVFTARIFPEPDDDSLSFAIEGMAKFGLSKWELESGLV